MSRIKGKRQRHLCSEALERRELLTVSPHMIGDLNSSPVQPQDSAWLGDELFFAADDGTGDVEIWKSDGTPEGTVRVADIREGALGSMPRDFVSEENRVLFTAYTDQFGREQWATDGTELGTIRVHNVASIAATTDLAPFTPSGEKPLVLQGQTIGDVHQVGDWMYFATWDNNRNGRLWKSDGSDVGTTEIQYVGENIIGVATLASEFLVYATENWNSSTGPYIDVWRLRTDDDQSTRLARYNEFSSPKGEFASVGNYVYYSAGRRLYQVDSESRRPGRVATFDDHHALHVSGRFLYVVDDTEEGRKIWRGDGTVEDPQFVELELDALSGIPTYINGKDGSALFWTAGDGQSLWRANTSETALTQVNDVISGASIGGGGSFDQLVAVGDRTYFPVHSSDGSQLWQSDGTVSARVEGSPLLTYDSQLTKHGDYVYFVGTDNSDDTHLWRTDGSLSSTTPVTFDGTRIANPANLTVSDGMLYFVGSDDQGVRHIWESDGTGAGTTTVMSLASTDHTSPQLSIANAALYFNLSTETASELWKKEAGRAAERVAETPGWIEQIVPADSNIFLHVREVVGEMDGRPWVSHSLWVSDGTKMGTSQLTDNYASSAFASGDRLFFLGYAEETGEELWVSDGTQAGTYMVKDIVVGSVGCGGNDGIHPVAYDEGIYFAAEDSDGVNVLWKSDGTEAGTVRISGIHGDPLASVNGRVYFANTDGMGTELWQSDGTVEGSVRISDINPGPGSSLAKYPASVAGGKLYITANDGFHGYELWSMPLEQEAALPGDADGNDIVNFQDFLILSANFGQTDAVFADGDFNNNGTVDFADFLILSSSFGEQQPTA